ncbi:MAG: tetratricopeptide repeat protein [Bacteroidota bacterium]
MKKIIFIVACLCMNNFAWAQKVNIENARIYLRDQQYDKAKAAIDAAVNNESTAKNANAWFTRGDVYMALMENATYKKDHPTEHPNREAARSYIKVVELKPDYPKEDINPRLYISAQLFYNDAANSYNNKEYQEAVDLARFVKEIYSMDAGKRFHGIAGFDTVAAEASVLSAFSNYYADHYDDALPLLLAVKDNPYVKKQANVYLILATLYRKKNNEADLLAIVQEGRKQFPDNQNLKNEELNYYIRTGKQDELVKKLEESVAQSPNNAELQFNLATSYNNLAFPKDEKGKDQPKPAAYADYIKKAEAAYLKAINIDPKNAVYNYNTGALYFNQAIEVNDQMNALSTSAADMKKYDELKAKRDAMFVQAMPFLETTYSQLEPKSSTLNNDDKFTYKSCLIALKEIYSRQNKMDKANEMKGKLDTMKK